MFQRTRWIHLAATLPGRVQGIKKGGGGLFLLDDKVRENSWSRSVQIAEAPSYLCRERSPLWQGSAPVMGSTSLECCPSCPVGTQDASQLFKCYNQLVLKILHTGSCTESSNMLKRPLSTLHFQEEARRKISHPCPSVSELQPDYSKTT